MKNNQRSNREKNQETNFGPGTRAAYITCNYGNVIVRPDTVEDAAPAAGPSPFKGLLPYTTADESLFFGREATTEKLVSRLQETHFLALVGASGSGKSSLIAAGLTPALCRQEWLVHTFTPSVHPLHELAKTLRDADPDLAPDEELIPKLVVNPRALPLAANRLVGKHDASRLLLVVDQFEELFTLCEDPAERRAFLETLTAAAGEQGAVTVLIAVHAGFYDRCLQHKGLRAVLAQAQEPLAPLAGADLLRAIAEPARAGGWHFVEGLLERFLENAGSDPGNLPLVSQALFETWKRRQGSTLTFAGYRAAGGIDGAIAQSAETALRALPSDQVELAKNIFITLADLGEGVPDTRRRVSMTELSRLGPTPEVASVVARMMRARLLTAGRGRVQIAHESLITHWPRLREWLAGDQERARFEQRLVQDAQTWEALGRDSRALYQGAQLRHALAWRAELPADNALPALSVAFLDASEEFARREREQETDALRDRLDEEAPAQTVVERAKAIISWSTERQFELLGALAALALVVILAGTVAVHFAREAEAEARRTQAEVLAARSINALPEEPLTALSLAWQAVDHTFTTDGIITTDARVALRHALSLPVPAGALQAHQAPITGVIFNPDGDRLLTLSLDGSARLWDPDGIQLARFKGSERGVIGAGFNEAGERIFTLGQDGVVRLWDLRGTELAQIGGEGHRVTVAAFDPAGEQLLTGSRQGALRLWDLQGTQVAALADHLRPIRVARFSPGGDRILAASGDSVRIWDRQGVALAHLQGHSSGITDAGFSPDGERVVTASHDRSARIWDLAGNELARLQGHDDVVWSAAFNPVGDRVVTAGGDKIARVWDVQGNLLALLGTHKSGVALARFHPDGERVLTVSWDGDAHFWDAKGRELVRLADPEISVNAAYFDASGARMVTADMEGGVRIWEMGVMPASGQAGSSRARLAGSAGTTYPSNSALWTAGRARLVDSPACRDLFDETICAGR